MKECQWKNGKGFKLHRFEVALKPCEEINKSTWVRHPKLRWVHHRTCKDWPSYLEALQQQAFVGWGD